MMLHYLFFRIGIKVVQKTLENTKNIKEYFFAMISLFIVNLIFMFIQIDLILYTLGSNG